MLLITWFVFPYLESPPPPRILKRTLIHPHHPHLTMLDSVFVGKEVELQLRPHPSHPVILDHAIRNLVTSPLCTVSHLAKYISRHPLLTKTISKNKGKKFLVLRQNTDKCSKKVIKGDMSLLRGWRFTFKNCYNLSFICSISLIL